MTPTIFQDRIAAPVPGRISCCQTNPPTDPDVKVSLIRFFSNPSGGTTRTHNFAVRSRDQMLWMILGLGKGLRSNSFSNLSHGIMLLWLRRPSQ